MKSLTVRLRRTSLRGLLILAALAIAACGDSDNGPPPPEFNVAPVAESMSAIQQTLFALGEAQKSLADLAGSIAPVMRQSSFPSIAEWRPGLELDRVPGVRTRPEQISVLSARSSWTSDPDRPPPPRVRVIPGGPIPFGATCVWILPAEGWKGGPDKFGDPPADGTYFELYETDSSGALAVDTSGETIPLDGNAFASVRPMTRGTVLDVETQATQSGQTVLDVRTQGTVGGPNIFDVSIRDGKLAAGTTVLDFDIDVTETVIQSGGDVLDIRIDETLALTQSGSTFTLQLRKTGVGAQTITFTLELPVTGGTVTSGSVTIDQQPVATVSGSTGALLFTVTDDRFPPAQRVLLGDIFDSGNELGGSLLDVLLFGACVGADGADFDETTGTSAFCEALVGQ